MKKLMLMMTALCALCMQGFAGDPVQPLPVEQAPTSDVLWLDTFASYNFDSAAESDPWGYGIGANFFPGGGNIGFGIDYMLSDETSAANAHRMNVGISYRIGITDNVDLYASGFAGYLVGNDDISNLENNEYSSVFQYGARAGARIAPMDNLPVALFADYGRTWADSGDGYNSARAGLSFFF